MVLIAWLTLRYGDSVAANTAASRRIEGLERVISPSAPLPWGRLLFRELAQRAEEHPSCRIERTATNRPSIFEPFYARVQIEQNATKRSASELNLKTGQPSAALPAN